MTFICCISSWYAALSCKSCNNFFWMIFSRESRLYKRVCLSVCPSADPSIGQSDGHKFFIANFGRKHSQSDILPIWQWTNLTMNQSDFEPLWHSINLTFYQSDNQLIWHSTNLTFNQSDIQPIWHSTNLIFN